MLALFGKIGLVRRVRTMNSRRYASRDRKLTPRTQGPQKGDDDSENNQIPSLSTVRHLRSPQVTNSTEAFPMQTHA